MKQCNESLLIILNILSPEEVTDIKLLATIIKIQKQPEDFIEMRILERLQTMKEQNEQKYNINSNI